MLGEPRLDVGAAQQAGLRVDKGYDGGRVQGGSPEHLVERPFEREERAEDGSESVSRTRRARDLGLDRGTVEDLVASPQKGARLAICHQHVFGPHAVEGPEKGCEPHFEPTAGETAHRQARQLLTPRRCDGRSIVAISRH